MHAALLAMLTCLDATTLPYAQLDLSHWQVVWRYSAYQHTRLVRSEGAIALSSGSPAGAPVRLVDTFSSDGVPGGAPQCRAQGSWLGCPPAEHQGSARIEMWRQPAVSMKPHGVAAAGQPGAPA